MTDLLAAAMPDLPAVPDRADRVREGVDVKGGDLTVPLDAFAELCRAQGGRLDPTPRW